ncbi:MAG: LysE family transporter [Acidobacteria bacterium]|nr:LysE family transporter [Acidobacteriota bacterium]
MLFLFALGLGVVAAIPPGGCQVEMAKRAVGGHLHAAWMVVCGSVTSDLIYGAIALFGVAPFLEYPRVSLAFKVVGAVLLWVLAYLTYQQSRHPQHLALANSALKSRRWAYLTGFSLGLSNLPIVLSWLLGVSLARQMGLASPLTSPSKIVFLAGVAAGLGSYLSVLAVVLHRAKHSIPVHALGRVYYWLGIALFCLSFYFLYGVVKYFNPAI